MSRNVKESDDEMETKSGRRTRAALNPSVLDSPLRRSSRIKQPAQQDNSSPDSVSDVSSAGNTRTTRRRTVTGDATLPAKSRTRRNSVASDASELTESESLPDAASKRVTRRSVSAATAAETPPNLNGRPRRTARAGSESKSTPTKGRATRKTRASSLEPEGIEDQKIRDVGTPVKSRRRASALPSEPAVVEESDDSGRGGRRAMDNIVYEIDEDEPAFADSPAHNTSKSSRRKSKTDAEPVELMEVDESPESPTSGANEEEASNVSDEEKRRKSASNRRSLDAGVQKEKSDEIKEKSPDREAKDDRKTLQSDDDSEYEGYPAFKDIPADEWRDGDTVESKRDMEIETNSVNSVSTERNESDCDFELVDKEAPQSVEKDEERGKSDYDSDDTAKTELAAEKAEERKDEEKEVMNELVVNQETPMDITSDAEEEQKEIETRAPITQKRRSSETSRRIEEMTQPFTKKLISPITDEAVKCPPIGYSVSRRKVLLCDDDESSDVSNFSMILNSSSNKFMKKYSLNASDRPEEEAESENKRETDNATVVTPKMIAGKSPGASGKKLKDRTLDTSTGTASPTNTLSNAERRANTMMAKRNWSLNRSAPSSELDDAEGHMKNSSSNRIDSTASPQNDKERLDRSAKMGSGRKSLNDKNSSKNAVADSDIEPRVSKEDPPSSDIQGSGKKSEANKNFLKYGQSSGFKIQYFQDSPASPDSEVGRLERSVNIVRAKKSMDKNNSLLSLVYSDSETAVEVFEESPASPDPEGNELETSVKLGSAKKSANKNISKSVAANLDSEVDVENLQEKLDKSATTGSNEKSRKSQSKVTEKSTPEITTDDQDCKENVSILSKSGSAKKSAIADKFGSVKKSANKNTWKGTLASSDFESDDENSQATLEKSAKIGSAEKSAKKNTSKSADAFSDSEIDFETAEVKIEESAETESALISATYDSKGSQSSLEFSTDHEDVQENFNRSWKSGSGKKSINDKNYSTIAQINSDSDIDTEVESDDSSDDANVSRKIPQFLFDMSTSDEGSINSDVARDMNLDGKSTLEYSDDDVPADDCIATESEFSDDDDDGADLVDFVVDDDEDEDEDEDVATALGLDDNEKVESFNSEKKKPRRRVILRPADASDSDESDEEEPMNVCPTLDNSKTAKTPTVVTKLNKTQETLEPAVAKNKNLLVQSSTPKMFTKQSVLSEKSSFPNATTPLSKLAKPANSPAQPEVSHSMKLSKSVCETITTPTKLGSSFKFAKTPKMNLSLQQQLQTSLPADLIDSAGKTNLSKAKSTKISALNQTVVPPGSESPETRFLMKEKLNDSLPPLKLQQRAKTLRRSALGDLREEIQATDNVLTEIDNIQKNTSEKAESPCKEEAANEPEVTSEKKKKKKKRKKRENSNASENPEEDVATPLIESVTKANDDKDSLGTSGKKSKKLNKKKRAAEMAEPEEMEVEEISIKKKKIKQEESSEQVEAEEANKKEKKKKKKKQQEESAEQVELNEPEKKDKKKRKKKQQEESTEKVELDETDKTDKKKKKDRKSTELAEPELPTLRQKSKRIAARNIENSESDEAPEAIGFAEARDKALRDFRNIAESIKAGKEAKKKKHQEYLSSRQERKTETHAEAPQSYDRMKTSVKRLPADVLANLSDVVDRPKKRRKVVNEDKPVPPKTIFSPHRSESGNFVVDDGYIPLSSSGGTTHFTVVNLKKAAKYSKKSAAVANFREQLLARNPRHPISAYLMYQQKQKSSGKDRLY